MDIYNGLIDKWAEDAMSELGEKSWRDVDTNSLLLIVYSLQKAEGKKTVSKITKPFWWLLTIIAPGVLWYIISGIIGL